MFADQVATAINRTGRPYRNRTYEALVLQLLGRSVEDLFESCGRHFTMKTILQIVVQMLSRIEYVHSKHIIFRDIKVGLILYIAR